MSSSKGYQNPVSASLKSSLTDAAVKEALLLADDGPVARRRTAALSPTTISTAEQRLLQDELVSARAETNCARAETDIVLEENEKLETAVDLLKNELGEVQGDLEIEKALHDADMLWEEGLFCGKGCF